MKHRLCVLTWRDFKGIQATRLRKSTLIFTKKEVIKVAVFRIERIRDYTVMSNHHLRDTGLSLKSKGLAFHDAVLPGEWNYTTRGLAAIAKRGPTASARPSGIGAGGVYCPQPYPRQQGQDRRCGVRHLRNTPQATVGTAGAGASRYGNPDMDTPCPEMTAQLERI